MEEAICYKPEAIYFYFYLLFIFIYYYYIQAGGNLFICVIEEAFIKCPTAVLTQIVVGTTRKLQMLSILKRIAC